MKLFIMIFFFIHNLQASENNCQGANIARALDKLTEIGRLHNCYLEVIKMETRSEASDIQILNYAVYGKDLFRCKTTEERICPKALFEMSISKACLSSLKDNFHEVEYESWGFDLDNQRRRSQIFISMNSKDEVAQMSFGQLDISSNKKINYVSCKINPLLTGVEL